MSQQDDSENDIWEYKPLKKTKRQSTSEPTNNDGPVAKKRKASKRITKGETAAKQAKSNVKPSSNVRGNKATSNMSIQPPSTSSPQSIGGSLIDNVDLDNNPLSSGGFCPICQMPFSMLVAQSLQRWHVTECLDTPGDDSKECPDGVQCSSTIQSHYKRYSHAVLAHSRATNDVAHSRATHDAVLLSLSQTSNESPSCSFSAEKGANEMSSFGSVSSQDSDLNIFTLSSPSVSPINIHCGTSTPSKPTNALLLLRSPGLEDIRKKKGWSSTVKGRKSTKASQESKTKVLTPVNTDCESLAIKGGFVKAQPSPLSDDGFSYSPLSEYPPDLNVNTTKLRKELFPLRSASEHENDDDSVILPDDSLSMSVDQEFFSGDTQVMLVSSSADINQTARSTAANENVLNSSLGVEIEELAEVNCNGTGTSSGLHLQSPQSIVLERLRERISDPNSRGILHSNSFTECPAHSKTEETSAYTQQAPSSSQISSSQLSGGSMTPRKGQTKAGPASGLKQMDIGVFFGLKPLKEKEAEGAAPERKPGAASGRARRERAGGRQGRRGGAGVGVAEPDGTTGASVAEPEQTTDDVNTQSTRGEGRRGGRRRWRNWGRTDGEEPKRCPFYKKIPGTKFVVDAFQYGVVDGVTAYFLTHFHSDHYGGLKKNSTFPIYCNKITGNLVKSKLKVQEEYVHVLPMNTEVTVGGVRVILLEANHCPGAAMLLFFLPDGQVVLHVGDFRANPSMEHYPELLSCRVQTLYLDTTYCSPEYTFPSQKDVISFAANTAFERVTLNPRTLIVCGSYSVGKEKVFLALAEVLGSKVCMSRDKFNTMCCLESERVRQLITTDWKAAQVHVLPMMQLGFKKLQAHLGRFSGQYDQLVAFKPTGWTFSQNAEAVENVLPQTDGSISIYGVPYSEHSSFLELKRFVQWLRPLKIIPTVNVGSQDSRKAMEKCFREWLMEANGDAN